MKSTKSGQSNLNGQPPRRRICTSWMVPLLLLWMMPAGLGLMMAGRVSAQVFTSLYSITPQTRLILLGNTLYMGTSGYWGGAIFAVNTDGTGFTNLYNLPGGGPLIGLILSSNTFYGMELFGSEFQPGDPVPITLYSDVFALNVDGTGFTNLCVTGATSLGGLGGGRRIISHFRLPN